jgi:hypothetical protein
LLNFEGQKMNHPNRLEVFQIYENPQPTYRVENANAESEEKAHAARKGRAAKSADVAWHSSDRADI